MQKQWNYYVLNKTKDVSKQIHANPKVEICAFKDGEWFRVAGELVEDDSIIGRNKDGTLNEQYCKWCYADGTYTYNNMEKR